MDAGPAGSLLAQRKERLEALKARRDGRLAPNRDLGAAVADLASAEPEFKPADAGKRPRWRGGVVQRKLLIRVHNVLTRTPEDTRGMVADTKFAVAGVERLMTLLEERSEARDRPGVKIARAVLQFLKGQGDQSDAIAGASHESLKRLSRYFTLIERQAMAQFLSKPFERHNG
jgi:hypothetical protein